jgi:outer membrane protein TolC
MESMSHKSLRLSRFVAVSLALLSAGVFAQEKDAPPADAPLQTAPVPFQPQIDDSMLAPLSRPEREIGTWEEARSLLLERSTDLRSAESGVLRAEGRWRQSLSALLPNASFSASAGINVLDPSAPPFVLGAGAATDGTFPLVTGQATVTQRVIDLGAWRGLSSAAAGERSAEASLSEAHRQLTQGLARSLVAVVAAERAAEINRISLR